MPVSFLLGLLVLGAASAATAQTADTTILFRQASKAASEHEWAVRRHAPFRISAGAALDCDERVGRFCLTFDSGQAALGREMAFGYDLAARPSGLANRPPRAAGWVGEKLGVASPRSPGNYRITLAVMHGNGNIDVVTRDFAVVSARRSNSPRP